MDVLKTTPKHIDRKFHISTHFMRISFLDYIIACKTSKAVE